MAIIDIRKQYELRYYPTTKTFKPLLGEIVYLGNVEIFIQNLLSVMGDSIKQVDELPFREIINIETASTISLENIRISGNVVMIQNTGVSAIDINIGTSGTPILISLAPAIVIMYKFNGSAWIPSVDSRIEQAYKTSSFTIFDDEKFRVYICDTDSDNNLTVILPTLVDNQDKLSVKIINIGSGILRIIGDTAVEKINGFQQIRLYSSGNYIEIIPSTAQWDIIEQNVTYDSGKINRSDWENVRLGTVVLGYDTSSGTIENGQILTGATSLAKGKIVSSTGTDIFLINVENGGIFINNESITTATFSALVNEPSGSNKDKDTGIILPELGDKIEKLDIKLIIYTANDDTTFREIGSIAYRTGTPLAYEYIGYTFYFLSETFLNARTGAQGIGIINSTTGNLLLINTQNWYYRYFIKINY